MAADTAKWVYSFGGGSAEGRTDMRNLLGGKGANRAEKGITWLACSSRFHDHDRINTAFYENDRQYPDDLYAQVTGALTVIENIVVAKFGDPERPLLVYVRSFFLLFLSGTGVGTFAFALILLRCGALL